MRYLRAKAMLNRASRKQLKHIHGSAFRYRKILGFYGRVYEPVNHGRNVYLPLNRVSASVGDRFDATDHQFPLDMKRVRRVSVSSVSTNYLESR